MFNISYNLGGEKLETAKCRPNATVPLMHWMLYVSVATVSFDVFLSINLGFNFRISQLFLMPVILYVAVTRLTSKRTVVPVGFYFLLVWSTFILLFVPNTSLPVRSAGYVFWLLFNIATIFIFVQLFRTAQRINQLIRYYIYSFCFVATFGLVQFILPLLGLGAPLVQQWWIPGVLARINGFSYEPSYFATYLIMGWVMVASLHKDKATIIAKRSLFSIYLLLTVAMILSSSRMGWLIMILWYLHYPVEFLFKLFCGGIDMRLFGKNLLIVVVCVICYILASVIGIDAIKFLIEGLGILGGSSHSSSTRINELLDTLAVFAESPFIGYSLGGVSSAIGELRGVHITDLEIAKDHEGMNVFAEVLAASGIIGGLVFAAYVALLFYLPIKFVRKSADSVFRPLVKALVISFGFELLMLQFNQNILRPYLWMHIAVLCCTYAVAQSYHKSQVPA